MLSIVAQFKVDYQTASKHDKAVIAQRVLELIRCPKDGSAPRFLKKLSSKKTKNGPSWCELEEKEVVKKIAHTLREQKSIVKHSTEAIRESQSTRYASDQDIEAGQSDSSRDSWSPYLEEDEFPVDAQLSSYQAVATTSLSDVIALSHSFSSRILLEDMLGGFLVQKHRDSVYFSSSSSIPVTDDEDSVHRPGASCSAAQTTAAAEDEPLRYDEEPTFFPNELHPLWSATMDASTEDSILDSFLDVMR
jgi:hypothetical protein